MPNYCKIKVVSCFSTYNYYNFGNVDFYDIEGNLITGLNHTHVLYQGWANRNTSASIDGLFNLDSYGTEPYSSATGDPFVEMIIDMRTFPRVSKVRFQAYTDNGGGKDIEVYFSQDNVTYTKVGEVTLPTYGSSSFAETAVRELEEYSTEPTVIVFPPFDTTSRAGINGVTIVETSNTGTSSVEDTMTYGGTLGEGHLWTIPINKKAITITIV